VKEPNIHVIMFSLAAGLVINTLLLSFAAQISGALNEIMSTSMLAASKRIIGGGIAVAHSYPFLVGIEFSEIHFCGGSIISTSWILTAAHCITPLANSSLLRNESIVSLHPFPTLNIVAGDHSKVTKHAHEFRVHPKYVFFHPRYVSDGTDFDIALLYLSSPLTYNQDVRAIELARMDAEPKRKCIVAGWGKQKPKVKKEKPTILLKDVSVPVLDTDKCRTLGSKYQKLTENMFCAGNLEGGHDSCGGDSGGPLFCKENTDKVPVYKQYGVTSWGPKMCGKKDKPGVYARISKLLPWIQSITSLQI